MFHVIEKEIKWRREQGLPEGFEALRSCKPIVAVGAEEPLGDPREIAAYFRKIERIFYLSIAWFGSSDTNANLHPILLDGIDGLGGVHTTVSGLFLPPLPRTLTILCFD